ncbi:MAG: Mur ligase family protein [Gemmatimonadota bacterium]
MSPVHAKSRWRGVRLARRAVSEAAVAVAAVWRSGLGRTRFVGVTGSCAKTTTKDLAAAVLATRLRGRSNRGTSNSLRTVIKTVLATRRSDDYCLQELGAGGPNSLDRSIALLRPHVGVVTNVGLDHYKAFRSREAVAAEKRKLVHALPEGGFAILNADDPHVLPMREGCRARVLTFGLAEGALVRGVDVRGAWPERLSLTLLHEGRAAPVATRLCGTHWAPAVLAALAVGVAFDVPLEEAVAAIERVEPAPGRMRPVLRDDGVTFVCDDWKAPLWSVPPLLEFMRAARASRKVLVVGTISDFPGDNHRSYARVARQALEVADHVWFVGRWSRGALKARREGTGEGPRAFPALPEAAAALRELLEPGDFVVLKGSGTVDGLGRLVDLSRRGAEVSRGQASHGAGDDAPAQVV